MLAVSPGVQHESLYALQVFFFCTWITWIALHAWKQLLLFLQFGSLVNLKICELMFAAIIV